MMGRGKVVSYATSYVLWTCLRYLLRDHSMGGHEPLQRSLGYNLVIVLSNIYFSSLQNVY